MLKGMGAGAMMAAIGGSGAAQTAQGADVVYELREYTANEGKLDALLARFRDHTIAIFKRHGMESVAYWTPTDDPLKGKTLVYILRHPSREAATANWAAFRADPEWVKVQTESEVNGKLAASTQSTFMKLTEFSARV
jgi:hypothetical protein